MKDNVLRGVVLLAFASSLLPPHAAAAASAAACLRECERSHGGGHCFTVISQGRRHLVCPAAGCEFLCVERTPILHRF